MTPGNVSEMPPLIVSVFPLAILIVPFPELERPRAKTVSLKFTSTVPAVLPPTYSSLFAEKEFASPSASVPPAKTSVVPEYVFEPVPGQGPSSSI
jgi:hypothetical protein